MGATRFLALAGLLAMPILAVTPGCRTATEATLDIALSPKKACADVHGTAITVGVDPEDTEQKVTSRFLTATTTECTDATHEIGTLVLTPGSEMRASVVVVTAVGTHADPSTCAPPAYLGCIVSRRTFSFIEHTPITIPITIDPKCVSVPCDEHSTCRDGLCFSSSISCAGVTCTQPGETLDGGTDLDASVTPDAGNDANPMNARAACLGDMLVCGDAPCVPSQVCCSVLGSVSCVDPVDCPSTRRCCTANDCDGRACLHGILLFTPFPVDAGAGDAGAGGGTPDGALDDAGADVVLHDSGPSSDAGGLDSGGGSDAGMGEIPSLGTCTPPN
jgi:hypothetical protein